jgi:hypothetical protein
MLDRLMLSMIMLNSVASSTWVTAARPTLGQTKGLVPRQRFSDLTTVLQNAEWCLALRQLSTISTSLFLPLRLMWSS